MRGFPRYVSVRITPFSFLFRPASSFTLSSMKGCCTTKPCLKKCCRLRRHTFNASMKCSQPERSTSSMFGGSLPGRVPRKCHPQREKGSTSLMKGSSVGAFRRILTRLTQWTRPVSYEIDGEIVVLGRAQVLSIENRAPTGGDRAASSCRLSGYADFHRGHDKCSGARQASERWLTQHNPAPFSGLAIRIAPQIAAPLNSD